MKSFKEYYLLSESNNSIINNYIGDLNGEKGEKEAALSFFKGKKDAGGLNPTRLKNLKAALEKINSDESKEVLNHIIEIVKNDSNVNEDNKQKRLALLGVQDDAGGDNQNDNNQDDNNQDADDNNTSDVGDEGETEENDISTAGEISQEEKDKQANKILEIIKGIKSVNITSTCKEIINHINHYANDGKITDREIKRAFAFANKPDQAHNISEQLSYILKIICLISLYNKNSTETFFTSDKKKIRDSIRLSEDKRNSIQGITTKNFEADDLLSKTLKISEKTSKNAIIKALDDYSKKVIDSDKNELANRFRAEDAIKLINSAKNKEELEKIKGKVGKTNNQEVLAALKEKEASFEPSSDTRGNTRTSPESNSESNSESVSETDPESKPGSNSESKPGSKPEEKSEEAEPDYSSYKRDFNAKYTDSKSTLDGKITKFFGSEEVPGTALSRYLKKLEEKSEALKAEQKELATRKENLKDREKFIKEEEIVAEAIIHKDYQILNEIGALRGLGLKANTIAKKAGNLIPRIGRFNQNSKSADSSWKNYKEKLESLERLYRDRAITLLDSARWETAPIKTKQKICFKLNVLALDFVKDLKTTFDKAVKRNRYNELGNIGYDIKNAALNRKEKKLDKYQDSRKGRTREAEAMEMRISSNDFLNSLEKLNDEDKNMLSYAIFNPSGIKAKADPRDKNSKTIKQELEEMLRSANSDNVANSIAFGVGGIKNLSRWLTIMQKRFGNDPEVLKYAKNEQNILNQRSSNVIADFIANHAIKVLRTMAKAKNDFTTKRKTPPITTENDDVLKVASDGNPKSITTESVLYKKYVLKEDVPTSEDPIITLIKGKNSPNYQNALMRFVQNFYKNLDLSDKELKEKIPVVEAGVEKFKDDHPELLQGITGEVPAQRAVNKPMPNVAQNGKPMQNNKPMPNNNVAQGSNPIQNGKPMQNSNPVQNNNVRKPIQTTVVTGDVGTGTIPDRLYRKVIRKKLGK